MEMKKIYNRNMIKYELPENWIKYDFKSIARNLVEARAAVMALEKIPYQRAWVEDLQQIELKREVAGTSRIEGADFTERELDEALKETPAQLVTRSQRQAHAAVKTYRWIAGIPDERPVDSGLIKEMHRYIVTGADDDHCEPGRLRSKDQNVNFGQPRHRGAGGGRECREAFERYTQAIEREYPRHDPVIQALAAHYHFAAMHPFLDGNGRTARALEALILQRAGLRDTCFIAMSNYYYDEKTAYLEALNSSHVKEHDITPFLEFGLKGIALQSTRLLEEIRVQVQKALFRNTMYDLFNRLATPRKRVIAERQLKILRLLLDQDKMELMEIYARVEILYTNLKKPMKAYIRDLNGLITLRAIKAERISRDQWEISLRLEWPTEITETNFMERVSELPKAKSYSFLG